MAGCTSCVSGAGSSDVVADPRLRRALWIALFLNATMFGVEAVAALHGRSVALQADAVDFFSDAANYGISLLVLGMGIGARARAALFKGVTMALVRFRRAGHISLSMLVPGRARPSGHGHGWRFGPDHQSFGSGFAVPVSRRRQQYALGLAVQPQ